MAVSKDHIGIVSILPAKYRPPLYEKYGRADNVFLVCESKWQMWEAIEEMIINTDEILCDDDIWVVSWDVAWDLDEVIREHESGMTDENGDDVMYEVTIWETFDQVSEDISYSDEWLGDPNMEAASPENAQRIAVDVSQMCTDWSGMTYGTDVTNAVVLPYIEWRCDLYGGRFRKAQ